MTGTFRNPSRHLGSGLLGLTLAAGLIGAAQARPLSRVVPYGYADSYAGPLIHGDDIGAPYTRFPRPTELVPSAWSYGTYGIPTVAGIRSAPVGIPTVYVIEAPRADAARAPRQARPRILSRARGGQGWRATDARPAPVIAGHAGSARVITVGVPPRQVASR